MLQTTLYTLYLTSFLVSGHPSIQLTAQEQTSQHIQKPPNRMKVLVNVDDETIALMEGGNYSIDIRRDPIPLKSQAMRDFLTMDIPEIPPEEGIYFGNQNQFHDDRDAAMAKINGLKVYGVDEKQETIVEEVEGIGIGMDATLQKLQEIIALPSAERPAFIGFDVDDTLLGLRPDKTKEDLLIERRSIAEIIAKLALEDIHIIFFSDGGSQTTLNRIGYPLAQILQENSLQKPVNLHFYVSGMLTKIKLLITPNNNPEIIFSPYYGKDNRLSPKSVAAMSEIIGRVSESEQGSMHGSGLLGAYYFENLTLQDSNGLCIRNTGFHPEFKTQLTLKGNVTPPTVDVRDFNPAVEDAAMISITGLPSTYRPILIEAIVDML